jgi:hypothetical protein
MTNDDYVNLEKAALLVSDGWGIYIPQHFAKTIKREFVTGVGEEDWKILEAGPDHEHYWDAWAGVLDNASVNDPQMGECYIHQDGDLWLVPVERKPGLPNWEQFDAEMLKFYQTRVQAGSKTAREETEAEFGEDASWCEQQLQKVETGA